MQLQNTIHSPGVRLRITQGKLLGQAGIVAGFDSANGVYKLRLFSNDSIVDVVPDFTEPVVPSAPIPEGW